MGSQSDWGRRTDRLRAGCDWCLERHCFCAELILGSPVFPNPRAELVFCLEKRLVTVF